jgi:plastocyanin
MSRKLAALSVAFVALVVVACGGRNGSGSLMPTSNSYSFPSVNSDLVITAVVPPRTIGEELPSEGLGTVKSGYWEATLGGYTQTRYSQALGFPPGTKITIRNLSKTTEHTLDVVKKISGPPADFPKNPKLSIPPKGDRKLEVGYASGPIKPGKSRTVTLVTPGIYLIGCAFHYSQGMHDVLRVAKGAKPGPQATPPSKGGPSPTPTVRSSYAPGY